MFGASEGPTLHPDGRRGSLTPGELNDALALLGFKRWCDVEPGNYGREPNLHLKFLPLLL